MADEPEGAERLYLKDGYNYIKISPDTIVDKIQFMLARPDLCDAVAEAGYLTALKHHTCYQRAVDFYVDARRILFGLPPEKEPVPPRSIIDGLRQALSLGKGKRRR
jgi:hypothetical protein